MILAISLVANLLLLFVLLKDFWGWSSVPNRPTIDQVKLEPQYTNLLEEDLEEIVENITDTDVRSYINLMIDNKGRFAWTDNEDFYYINRGYGYGDTVPEKYQELFDCLDWAKKVDELVSDQNKLICKGQNKLYKSTDTNYAFIKDFVKMIKAWNKKVDFECISLFDKVYDGNKWKSLNTKMYLVCNALKSGKVEDLVLPYEDMRIQYTESNCTNIAHKELIPYCKTLFAQNESTAILTEKQKTDKAISEQKAKEEIKTEPQTENE